MVPIPGGTFQMGAESGPGDQRPIHPVTVAAFLMGVAPVTVGEFASFVAASGYVTEAERDGWCVAFVDGRWERTPGLDWNHPGFVQTDDHPVTCVSWNDAQAYVAWLNRSTGGRYRLPTEAEWEFAARTGHRGETEIEVAAWFQGNSGGSTHPARRKLPDAHGLHDMVGNVWEWCSDRYGSYTASAQRDPQGPGDGSMRVNRGGAWYGADWSCLTRRGKNTPDDRGNGLGFRLAASPPQASQP